MRQLVDEAGFVPSEPALALAELIVSLSPCKDEEQVARGLRAWANEHWGEGALEPGLADGAGQVAEHMRLLGMLESPPTDSQMLGIAFHMLRNVAAGRGPTDYDLLGDHIVGFNPRTARRYKQRARAAGLNPGLDALHQFMASFQYDLDVAALVRAGRTPAAARRWLERNPGKHARDAPAPRRPRVADVTGRMRR
jgi:hypothetical protein